jgi:hypothetical protein
MRGKSLNTVLYPFSPNEHNLQRRRHRPRVGKICSFEEKGNTRDERVCRGILETLVFYSQSARKHQLGWQVWLFLHHKIIFFFFFSALMETCSNVENEVTQVPLGNF